MRGLRDEPVAGTDRRGRLDDDADDVDPGERRERALVRTLAEQRAGPVHTRRVEEHDLRLRSVVRTPRISLRVVCGLSETIATLRPTMRFTSVDLPTLGRPTTATNPERKPSGAAVGRDRSSSAGHERLIDSGTSVGGRTRLINTDTMRRPCTRSAQNSSPSTVTHSPSSGT